jgi:hypothetical protein
VDVFHNIFIILFLVLEGGAGEGDFAMFAEGKLAPSEARRLSRSPPHP